MLTNNNSKSVLRKILVLPLLLLIFTALAFKKSKKQIEYEGKKVTVVIDAGHGGKDNGAIGANGIYEKDITLAIVKKIKALNSNANIDIVLSRDEDIYQTPPEKATFSNQAKADIVVSIHVAANGDNTGKDNSGMEIFVSKDNFSNAAKSKLLASAMIATFKLNYPLEVTGSPIQRKQGIWLLQASECPAILIETGYIDNEKDLAFLQSEEGKEIVAQNVLAGIQKYFSANDAETGSPEQ